MRQQEDGSIRRAVFAIEDAVSVNVDPAMLQLYLLAQSLPATLFTALRQEGSLEVRA
ncbi:hypothetical protein X766_27480 [Mesorhizobium sp. LSJC255A00]|nr:hypothetical protein X766_27480 [Mesorhizobium sp. LSJC255A00]